MDMDMDDIEFYESFEDWLRDTLDRNAVTTLRDSGAWAIPELNDPNTTLALFKDLGGITELALDRLGVELWEIARDRKIQSVVELIEILVHAAAESLAHSLADEFEVDGGGGEAESEAVSLKQGGGDLEAEVTSTRQSQ